MKYIFTFLLFYFISVKIYSQTIAIDLGETSSLCSGSTKTIRYMAYGFGQNIPFSILISNASGQFLSNPDTLAKSTITNQGNYQNIDVLVPASVNIYSSNYKVKAVWQGGSSSLFNATVNTDANIAASVSGSYNRTACNNSSISIPITIFGQGPLLISYRDSLRNNTYKINTYNSVNTHYYYNSDTAPNRITFLGVSNACGTGIATGTAKINIIYPIISIGQPSDTVVCAGEIIRIPYTNSITNCPVSFQLSDASGNNFRTIAPQTYVTPNNYNFIVPDDTPAGDNYKIRIVNYAKLTSPIPSDSVLGQFTLKVKARPKITVSNTNALTGVFTNGAVVPIQFSMTGTPPFNFYFNLKRYYSESPVLTVPYTLNKPQQIEYGNVIDASGCFDQRLTNFFVQAEIYPKIIASPAETPVGFVSNYKFRNYCRGQQMRVDYKIVGSLPDNTKLKIQIKKINELQWIDLETVNGYEPLQLLGTIPNDVIKGNYEVRVLPENSEIKVLHGTETKAGFIYASNIFTIIAPLEVTLLSSLDSINIRKREGVYLRFQAVGGAENYTSTYLGKAPFSITLKNSQNNNTYTISNENYWNGIVGKYQIYIDSLTKNTTFEIQSVSSPIECSNTQFKGKLAINVDASTRDIKISSDGSSYWYQPVYNICGGTQLTVPIWKVGSFNADNKFKIFLSRTDNREFFEVPTIDNGNNTVTITVPHTDRFENFYLRAEASSPKTLGAVSNSIIYVPKQIPSVSLSGEYNVIAGTTIEFKANFSMLEASRNIIFTDGTNEYSFFISDSSIPFEKTFKITIPTNTPAGSIYITTKPFSNSCGQAVLSGSIKVNVLTSPQIIISNPSNLCYSDTEKRYNPTFDFNSSLTFSPKNTFKARIINKNQPSSNPIEYEATLINGKISISYSGITYPSVNLNDIQIISTEPYAVSNFHPFANGTNSSVSVTASSIVPKGSTVNINYTFSGIAPFKMKVLEGENLVNLVSNSTTLSVSRVINNSMVFRVVELEDAVCKEIFNQSFLGYYPTRLLIEAIQVARPIEITKINKTTFCQNDIIELDFIKNKLFSDYYVELNEIGKNDTVQIYATINGNRLSALLPPNLISNVKYQVRIKAIGDGTDVSFPYPYTILVSELPTATISGSTTLIKNENQFAQLTFQTRGVLPFQINYSDGINIYSLFTNDSVSTVKVQPSESTSYFISSVKNACSYGTASGIADVNVLSIKTNHIVGFDGICYGQTLVIPFSTKGKFDSNNQFKIQLRRLDASASNQTENYYTLDATLNGNALYANLPISIPFSAINNKPYNIRVISTQPAIVGDYAPNLTNTENHNMFVWGNEPVISLSGNPSISPGESFDLNVNVNGSSNFWYFRVNDGQTNFYYYPTSFPYKLTFNPAQTTTYTINQFYSACGGIIGNPSALSVTIDPCPSTKIISSTVTNGNKHFEAKEMIEAQNQIKTGAKVEYNAGKYLLLTPGFRAELNAVFKAHIKGCEN